MENLFNLAGKVAVVTGATGVLSKAASLSLAKAGVNLVLLSRDVTKLESFIKELKEYKVGVLAVSVDILSKESLETAKTSILKEFKSIDILLNIAGGNLPGATVRPDQTIFDISVDDFNSVTNLNLNGTLLPCLVFGKQMAEQKKGTIINYTSMATQRVITRVAGYSASKAAMENFTKWMAVEMAMKFGEGVRVNAIAPGFFIGKQNKTLLTNEDGSYTDRGNTIITNTPMGRFGKAEELNGAIQFLCSDASAFVTGAVIPVDGGFNVFSGV